MSNLLSRSDIEELTGYKQSAAQLRWLHERGITAWINGAGRVVATWAAVENPTKAIKNTSEEPDFKALFG